MKSILVRSTMMSFFTLAALIATRAVQAQAPPSNMPLVITQPGVYVLNRDIAVPSGDAITIRASGVTLDLNGRNVTTTATPTTPFATRGIWVDGMAAKRKGVTIKNGKVSGFNLLVSAGNVENLVVEGLQLVGTGAAPNGGPTEVGIMLVDSRGGRIGKNTISSVNLGLFVRGGGSTGNRLFENTITGGETAGNNLLGICYNPAPGAGTAGPRGDVIYNNHIARFDFAIAISAGSVYNIWRENTLASHTGNFREPQTLTSGGGTNVADGNLEVTLPPVP